MKGKSINLPKTGKAHSIRIQPVEQSSKMHYKGMGSGSVVRKGRKSSSKEC